tara:strand:- start:2372 stop:2785 length:414 start_codon:yes stop_codon:yes gene_type:complete
LVSDIFQQLETDVKILQKEVQDMKTIHLRLDAAIVKISEVSNSINRMLAVHEEKLSQQEEAQMSIGSLVEQRRIEFKSEIVNLHTRISDNKQEVIDAIRRLEIEVNGRVGVLERWRWLIIGGSIVIGFILHKFMIIP